MGKVFNGGFSAATAFNRKSNEPLDDSLHVVTINDLKTHAKCYKGITVTIHDTLKQFKWNGLDQTNLDNWIEVGAGTNISGKADIITTVFIGVSRSLTNLDSGKLIVTDSDITLTIPVGLINTFNASFSPLTGGKITFAFASSVFYHAPNGLITFEDNTTTLIYMSHNSKYLVRP